jgi:ubiquitin C-terminal hydrolase
LGPLGTHHPAISMFYGILTSQVVCLNCGSVSDTSDPFLDISLSIPEKKINSKNKLLERLHSFTLIECMNLFTKIEELSDDEKFNCAMCSTYQKCTKKLSLKELPQVGISYSFEFIPRSFIFTSNGSSVIVTREEKSTLL